MPSPKSPHDIRFLLSRLSINKVPILVSKEVDQLGCPLEEKKKRGDCNEDIYMF
jgi:hypothetical protein